MVRDDQPNRISGARLNIPEFFPKKSCPFRRWDEFIVYPQEIWSELVGLSAGLPHIPGAWISEVGSLLPRIYLVSP